MEQLTNYLEKRNAFEKKIDELDKDIENNEKWVDSLLKKISQADCYAEQKPDILENVRETKMEMQAQKSRMAYYHKQFFFYDKLIKDLEKEQKSKK